MISNKWAIQRVFNIKLFSLITGENIGLLEDLKQSNFSNDGTIVYAQGQPGNVKLVAFDHSKSANISAQSATFDFNTMATQIGADVTEGANSDLVYTDIVKVSNDTATINHTALGVVGSEIKFAYIKNADNTLGKKFEQITGTVATGKFTYTSGTKALAFFADEVPDNTEIVVFYNVTTGETTRTISSYTDQFGKEVKMVADGMVRDIVDGQDYACQLIFSKGKVSNKWEMALQADGNPSIQNIDIEALGGSNKKLWDMIVYDEADIA